MILDGLLSFTNPNSGDAITAALTNQPFSNSIDFGINGLPVSGTTPNQPIRDMGIGDDPALKILAVVSTAFAGGTNVIIKLQGAPDNGSGAEGTYVDWWASPTYTTAQLIQGARLFDMDFPRPPLGVAIPRFVRLVYTSTGTFTAGTIKAYIVLDRVDQIYNALVNATLGGYTPGITIPN
jgi:hypothetical protein